MSGLSQFPRTVRVLAAVSFANDAASEMLYPVLPLFVTIVLHAPVAALGLVEGLAEAVAVVFRAVVGPVSDRHARRRPWIVGGYAASITGRFVIAIAPAWGVVLAGRVIDRFGKAVRTPPRDALIRDAVEPQRVGAAFGFHRAFDSLGAVAGPLIAVALIGSGVSLRGVILFALVPGVVTLSFLFAVRETARAAAAGRGHVSVKLLPRGFWVYLAAWCVFSVGNLSDVFFLLRAKNLGLSALLTVLAYALYNVVYSGLSWPLGSLSDQYGRRRILCGGLVAFAVVCVGFAVAPGGWAVWPLYAVYGVYIAATDGVGKALVADHTPPGLSATAFGVFSAATGACALVASTVAGVVWQGVAPAAAFLIGAVAALVAIPLLLASGRV